MVKANAPYSGARRKANEQVAWGISDIARGIHDIKNGKNPIPKKQEQGSGIPSLDNITVENARTRGVKSPDEWRASQPKPPVKEAPQTKAHQAGAILGSGGGMIKRNQESFTKREINGAYGD